MPEHTREMKAKLGALLLKVSRNEFGYGEEEWKLGRILEGRGLLRFVDPRPSTYPTSDMEIIRNAQLAALAHYALTGAGQDFVARHREDDLRSGRFLLPGELPWYERWYWKVGLPALVAMVTSIITAVITTQMLGLKK